MKTDCNLRWYGRNLELYIPVIFCRDDPFAGCLRERSKSEIVLIIAIGTVQARYLKLGDVLFRFYGFREKF